MVDIVKKFNWTYVSTIASEGSYGDFFIKHICEYDVFFDFPGVVV